MDASSWIALAALIVAILVAIRGERSLRVERKDRKKEDSRRDEELDLLRSQVVGEAAHRLSERQADLICRQGGRSSVGEGVDAYDVLIVNGGRATAHDLQAWIATENGQPITGRQHLGGLLPDTESPWFQLKISQQNGHDPAEPLFIRASWTDGAGEHEAAIDILGRAA
jgi:hypothetical protein